MENTGKPWKITRNLMLRCGNAGNGLNTPGSTELFKGVHRTVPACPWNRSGFFHGISGLSTYMYWIFHGKCQIIPMYPWKVVRILRGFSGDFSKSPRKSYSIRFLQAKLISRKLWPPRGGAYMAKVKKKKRSGERSRAIMALLFI